jgi:2,4-dienoyl-CoA reductase-like NADH-dependent reductase (Old Yellow Enzyme family)
MNSVMQEGFEFVQGGRAIVRDSGFVNKLKNGEIHSSDCDHCNRCVAEMANKGLICAADSKGLKTKEYKP